MESRFFKNNNNVVMLFVLLGAVVFFLFIMPLVDKEFNVEAETIKEKLENVELNVKLDKNMCSRQCCKFTQWPIPHDLNEKIISEEQLDKYIGTNFSCNFGHGSGCLCVSRDDFDYLTNRGQNTSVMCSK